MITNPVCTMLKTTGLEVVVDSAQTIAADISKEWFNIEESNSTYFDESLECPLDDSFELEETPPSIDKVQLLNRALVIIKDLHDIGIQLNDDHLMNGAVELCSHIASHPVNSTSVQISFVYCTYFVFVKQLKRIFFKRYTLTLNGAINQWEGRNNFLVM